MKNILIFALFFSFSNSSFPKFTYHYPAKQKLKIDAGILAYCMTKEISKYENPVINPSTIYQCNKLWAKKINTEGKEPDITVALYDRAMLDQYLQISAKRNCDYETGKEGELKKWVLKQNDNSIDHIKIFTKALELSHGRVWDALLMIHQLLRNEARYWSKKYYAYESNPVDEEKFWNKFIDIRGELPERGPEFKADHAGSWYRMWGMMLNRIADTREPIAPEKTCGEDVWQISLQTANLWNDFVAVGAEAIKPVLNVTNSYKSGGDLMGKTQINLAGSETAAKIDAYFYGKKMTDPRFKNIDCSKSPYVIPAP